MDVRVNVTEMLELYISWRVVNVTVSAPSMARFMDIYGNELGERFINVGQFFSENALMSSYKEILDIPDGAFSVVMYGKLYLIKDINAKIKER